MKKNCICQQNMDYYSVQILWILDKSIFQREGKAGKMRSTAHCVLLVWLWPHVRLMQSCVSEQGHSYSSDHPEMAVEQNPSTVQLSLPIIKMVGPKNICYMYQGLHYIRIWGLLAHRCCEAIFKYNICSPNRNLLT